MSGVRITKTLQQHRCTKRKCSVWTEQRPSFTQTEAVWNVEVICTAHLITIIWFHMSHSQSRNNLRQLQKNVVVEEERSERKKTMYAWPECIVCTCSGAQKIWASSWQNLRTRVRPPRAPESSLRCNAPKSAHRRGSSRQERTRCSNMRLNTRKGSEALLCLCKKHSLFRSVCVCVCTSVQDSS